MAETWAPGQAQLAQNSDGFHVPGAGMSVDVAGMPPEGPAGGEGNTPARRISRVYNILLEQLPRSVQQRVASQLVVMTSSLCQSQSCSLETATMVVQQQLLPRMQQALRRLQQQQQQAQEQDRGQAPATIQQGAAAGREPIAHRQPQHPSHGPVPAFPHRLSMPQSSHQGDGAGPPESVRTPIINQAPGVQLLRTSDQRLSVPGGSGPDPAGMVPGSPHIAHQQPQQQHVSYYTGATGPSYSTVGPRGVADHVPGMAPVDQSVAGPSTAMGYNTAMFPPQTAMRPQQYGLAASPMQMGSNHYPFPQQQGAQAPYGMAASLPVPMTAQQHNAIVAPPPPQQQQPHVFSMGGNIRSAWGTRGNNGNAVNGPHPMQPQYYAQQGRAQLGPQIAWGRDPSIHRPDSRSQFPFTTATAMPISPRVMEASTAGLFGASGSLQPPASTRVPSRGPSVVAWPGARTPSFDSPSFVQQQQQFGGRLRSPNHSLEPPPPQQRIDHHHGDTATPPAGLALSASSGLQQRSPVTLGQHSPYASYQPPRAFPQQQQVAMGPVQEDGVVPVRGMVPRLGLPLQRHEPLPPNHPATMEPTLCAGCGQLHVPTCTSWLCPPCCRAAALGPGPGLACSVHSVGGGGMAPGESTTTTGAARPPGTSFWPSLIGNRGPPSGALGPPTPVHSPGPEAATQQMRVLQAQRASSPHQPQVGAGYGQTGTAAAVVQQQQSFQPAGIPPAGFRTATPAALPAVSAPPTTAMLTATSSAAPVSTTHDTLPQVQSPGLRDPPQQNLSMASHQDRGGGSLPPPRASLLLSGAAASTTSRPPHKQAPHEGLVRYIARYWRRALAVPPAKRARRAAERVAEEVQELRHGALDRYMERIALLDELFDGEAADSPGSLAAEEARGQTFGQRALRNAAQRARTVESAASIDGMTSSASNVEDYAHVEGPLGVALKVIQPDPSIELASDAISL